MNKKDIILVTILACQVMAALGLVWQNNATVQQDKGFALFKDIDVLSAAQIEIVTGEANSPPLVLKKKSNQWILPSAAKADNNKVTELLNKLIGIKPSWPVATTEESQKRFEVAKDKFQRKVSLDIAGREYLFFVGTSPGYRHVHVRAKNTQNIYAVALNTFDFSAKTEDWLDKNQLDIKDKITAIEVSGYHFTLDDKTWQLNKSTHFAEAETTTNTVSADRAASISDTLKALSVIGVSALKNIDKPTEKITINTEKQQTTYLLLSQENNRYIQKQGESIVYSISKATYNNLLPTN